MDSTLLDLRNYLESATIARLGYSLAERRETKLTYVCFEDLVLDRGRGIESAALTPEERKVVLEIADGSDPFLVRECYANSLTIFELADALGNEGVSYWEGYAVGRASIPILHAWCTINGKVVDVTWRTDDSALDNIQSEGAADLSDRVLGTIPEGFGYYGIEFPEMDEQPPLIDDVDYNFSMMELPRCSPYSPELLERAKQLSGVIRLYEGAGD